MDADVHKELFPHLSNIFQTVSVYLHCKIAKEEAYSKLS